MTPTSPTGQAAIATGAADRPNLVDDGYVAR